MVTTIPRKYLGAKMRKRLPILVSIMTAAALLLLIPLATAATAETYKLTVNEVLEAKKFYDDPRPIFNTLSLRKVIPPAIYQRLVSDKEAMKRLWASVVGFKAP